MTYSAMLYLVFEGQDQRLGHRILNNETTTEIA